MRKKLYVFATVLCMSAITFCGCGTSDDANNADNSPEVSASVAPDDTDVPQDDMLTTSPDATDGLLDDVEDGIDDAVDDVDDALNGTDDNNTGTNNKKNP